ncbi:MAG: LamG domain-containing protein, partial [Candidatus Omnitrophica bacterium]|nr:LamG domain-containing protein [Candidatus Omnitrophota bacterium]
FSLAGPGERSPGDVLSGLQFWVRADAGVFTNTGCTSAAGNGNDIGCWQDQSILSNHVTEDTAAEKPDLVSTADDTDFNFNPSLNFDGGDQLTRTSMLSAGDAISVLAVFRKTSLSGNDQVIGFGSDSDDPGLETSGTALQVRNDASTPATLAHGTALTTNTTYLASFRAPNGTNTGVDLRLNGDEDVDATFDMLTLGAEVGIGADNSDAGTDSLDGEIAELVVYNADLSDVQIRRAESYLALKYGISIDQTAGTSYLSSNCSTTACNAVGEVEMWDSGASGASTYDNDLAGIGQDNISALSQTKSRSVNPDSLVTISAASDLDDLEFFMWGNDDGSITQNSSNVPGGLPGQATVRITREWLAQNNGGDGVGTVTVAFDLGNQFALSSNGTLGDYALLIDTDGDFSNATVHTTGASKSGDTITFTTADIRSAGDGLYFSLAGPPKITPGDVSTNIELWLKADADVFTDTGCTLAASHGGDVGCWADQIQGSDVIEGTSAEQPDWMSSASDEQFNFNPSLNFDGGDQLTRDTLMSSGDDISVLAVIRKNSLSGADQIIGFGTDADDPGLETNGTSLNVRNDASTPVTLSHGSTLAINNTYLVSIRALNGANNGADLRLNGDEDTDGTFDMVTLGAEVGIGSDYSTVATDPFDGEIAELVVYSADLSDLEIRRAESYLALKYGITIDQTAGTSYLASNCSTVACNGGGEVEMWDSGATGAGTYDNDIAGIGRDDKSALNQIKSRSVNADSIVTVSSASDLDDLEFLTWGNDDGVVNAVSANVPGGLPGLATVRVTREWLAQNNGGDGVGTVTVTFDLNRQSALARNAPAANYALLIDTDGDFSNATVHTTGASISGGKVTFTTADISGGGNGLYFSIAGPEASGPGDVSTNLEFWVKADAGVFTDAACTIAAGDADDIGCWQDQSVQQNDVTESTGSEQPDLIAVGTDRDFNFNPSLNFDGGDQ